MRSPTPRKRALPTRAFRRSRSPNCRDFASTSRSCLTRGRSWREARIALRFTGPREPVIRYEELGALALLAEIPQDASRGNADVAAIARVAGNPEDLETLDAYCATGSLRRAADLLHLHHSSVARRLEQIGKTLGIELAEPAGLMRARLAFTARRLLDD